MCASQGRGAHMCRLVLIMASLHRVIAAGEAAAPLHSNSQQIYSFAELQQPHQLPMGYLNGVMSLKRRLLANRLQVWPALSQQQNYRDMKSSTPRELAADQLHQQLEVDLQQQNNQLQQRQLQLAAQVSSGVPQQEPPQPQPQQQQQLLEPVKTQFEQLAAQSSGNQPQPQPLFMKQELALRDSQTDAESNYETKMQLLQQLADSLAQKQQKGQQQQLRSNVAPLLPPDPATEQEEACPEDCATTEADDDEDECDNTTPRAPSENRKTTAATTQAPSLTIRVDTNSSLTKTTVLPKSTVAAGQQTRPQSTRSPAPATKPTKSKAKLPCCTKSSPKLKKVEQRQMNRAARSDAEANLRIDAIATWLQYRKQQGKENFRQVRQLNDMNFNKGRKCELWQQQKSRRQRGSVNRKQVLQAKTKLWPFRISH